MQATIIGLGQQISFETGQVLNVLLLRLPSGAVIEATVGDEVAERLTSDWVASGGQMTGVSAAPTPTPTPLHVQPNEVGEFEFGGDLGEDAETLLAVQQSLQEAAEQLGGAHRDSSSMTSDEMRAVAKELRGETPTAPPARPRSMVVRADDMGYPVLSGPNMVDTTRLAGGNPQEDEDVGSI